MTWEGGTGGDGGGVGGAGAAVNFRDGIAIVLPFDVTSTLHTDDDSVVFDVAVVEFDDVDVGVVLVFVAVFGTAIFSVLHTPVVGFNCDDD